MKRSIFSRIVYSYQFRSFSVVNVCVECTKHRENIVEAVSLEKRNLVVSQAHPHRTSVVELPHILQDLQLPTV